MMWFTPAFRSPGSGPVHRPASPSEYARTLVAEFNVASTLLLTSWHPGASALSLAVVKPGPTQASLVVG